MKWETVALPQGGLARVALPESPGPWPVFLLLHGWTGDEYVMEPFARWLPRGVKVLFRAPFPQAEGGYGWIPRLPRNRRSTVEDYHIAVDVLDAWLPALRQALAEADWGQVHWVGFSQGAGTAALYTLLRPQTMTTYAGIVGFLPLGAEALVRSRPWQGKRAFAAWGRQDPIIPLPRAQEMEALLRQSGAALTVCYDDVGHKLGARCRQAWLAFYEQAG